MTYYEALRLRVRMERLANFLVAVFIGLALGSVIATVGWPWLYVVVGVVVMVGVVLSWFASDGLQKRINDGEFDKEDSTS